MLNTPNDLTDTQVNALVDFGRLPTLNTETLASGRANELDPQVRRAMRYEDCLGRTVTRTVDEAIAHVEMLRAEKAARDASRQRHLDHVHAEVRKLRAASGKCLRDTQCLRADGHADECVFDVRHLAMVEPR